MNRITGIKAASASASAPAKIILFGEHFVNYNNPAILMAINSRTKVMVHLNKTGNIHIRSNMLLARSYTVQDFEFLQDSVSRSSSGGEDIGCDDASTDITKRKFFEPIYRSALSVLQKRGHSDLGLDIDVSSSIPIGVGLGSSASCCVATLGAVNALFNKTDSRRWIYTKAIESERLIHKNSSGADCCACTFGGLVYYTKNHGFKKINPRKNFSFVIANTHTKRSTGDLVGSVNKFKNNNKSIFKDTISRAYNICEAAHSALLVGNEKKLGELMNENHRLLQCIGVSNERIDHLIEVCIKNGAIGAKITGAGGGGCIIALLNNKKHYNSRIISQIKYHSSDLINSKIDYDGLLIYNETLNSV
jgi:mevalonate kinase